MIALRRPDGAFAVLGDLCKCGRAFKVDRTKKYGLCVDCRARQRTVRQYDLNRKNRARYRQLCLDHYGRQCACCGETEEKFLVLDHIDNNGAEHRRFMKNDGGWVACQWLVRNNFPKEWRIRVLCANCNSARQAYGKCPHEV